MRFAPALLAGIAALTLACDSELDKCRTQLDATLADFYQGKPDELQVEHFAAFDRLPQHNAPACVTTVLNDATIDAAKRKRFELIAPL